MFVAHDSDEIPAARVLQTRGKELHELDAAVETAHVDLTDVVPRQFIGNALEPRPRPRKLAPQFTDLLVSRALAAERWPDVSRGATGAS